jgi:hypothetical protein
MWVVRQQRRSGHDLTGLTIAALDDLKIKPRFLNPFASRRIADGLDRGYGGRAHVFNWSNAGADGITVQMDRARPTKGHATAELGARHA